MAALIAASCGLSSAPDANTTGDQTADEESSSGTPSEDLTPQSQDSESKPDSSEAPSSEPAVPDEQSDELSGSEDEQLGEESGGEKQSDGTDGVPNTERVINSTPREDVPSALRDRDNPAHPEPLVDLNQIRSGGPPPDGIPPLEHPAFEPVEAVDWIAPQEAVLALEINGDARAYPVQIMTWHELVNGTVGGVPVTVSYCPLCNSAVAYDRRVGERILDFGTSGELLNSSLVMYDRQTESLWSHFTGQAVAGHLTGIQLDLLPMQTISFTTFGESYPDGIVLSLDTGFQRSYGRNPYRGYDNPEGRPFLFGGPFDDRLVPLTRVLAVRDSDGDGATVAIPYKVLAERRVVPFVAGGRELIALYETGLASALDTSDIADGRDVGATGVFELPHGQLALEPNNDDGFVDTSTGTVYNILGIPEKPADSEASTGAANLQPVEHLDTFWFAVAAFDPSAEIIAE